MNPVLEEILSSGFTTTRDGERRAVKDRINVEGGLLLQELIVAARPEATLEVGMATGVSTLFICEALSRVGGRRHVAIDPFQETDYAGTGIANVERAGLGHLLRVVKRPSHEALPALLAEGVRVDFAFIDGMHLFDYALMDFFFIDKMLNLGGTVVFDDCEMDSVRKVCRYVALNHRYRVVTRDSKDPLIATAVQTCVSRARKMKGTWRLDALLAPELLWPDADLALGGRVIAFKKEAEDERVWTHHTIF